MKGKLMTAEELLKELNKDPKFVSRQKEDDAKRHRLIREFEEAEAPLVKELNAIGIEVSSIGNASNFRHYLPLSPAATEVLLKWLPKVHWRVQEAIVALLANATPGYPGEPLVQLFERITNTDLNELPTDQAVGLSGLPWDIGNAIAETLPSGITQWVVDTAKNPMRGKYREWLLVAVARMASKDVAIPLLEAAFDEMPVFAAQGLSEIGDEKHVAFLRSRSQMVDNMDSRRLVLKFANKLDKKVAKKAPAV